MGDSSARQIANHRLDSWKEIAAFFDRDERTVRRWEKERSLPVHRVPGGARGGVFAYSEELREWLKGPGNEFDPTESGPILTLGQGAVAVSKRAAIDIGPYAKLSESLGSWPRFWTCDQRPLQTTCHSAGLQFGSRHWWSSLV
jgi:hypothetical protein